MTCDESFHSHFIHAETNTTKDNILLNGYFHCWCSINADKKNEKAKEYVTNTLNLADEHTSHKHTMQCWGDVTGTIVHTDQTIIEYPHTSDCTPQQPFLIVNECSTKVLKKEISLQFEGIQLITNVSAYTHIDAVTNGSSEPNKRKYQDEIPNINNCNPTKGAYLTNDRMSEIPYPNATFDTEQLFANKACKDPLNSNVWRTEDWKNIDNIAVVEAGDVIQYILTIVNNDKDTVDVQFEYILPDNIEDMITIQNMKPFRYDYNQGKNIYISDSNEIEVCSKTKTIDLSENHSGNKLTVTDFPTYVGEDQQPIGEKNGNEDAFRLYGTDTSQENDQPFKSRVIMYCITAKVKTAAESYDTNTPKQAQVNIIKTYQVKNNQTKGNGVANINNAEQGQRKESRDSFICKQYHVTVNKYILDVKRSDGTTVNEEYIVDNKEEYGIGEREKLTNKSKKDYPIYVENGDVVTYEIVVHNDANLSSPYYNPNIVTVSLKDTLPTETAEIISATGGNTWNGTGQTRTTQVEVPSKESVILTCTVKINTDQDKTYDYDTLRENKVEITDVTNINGKRTNIPKVINPNNGKEIDGAYRVEYRGHLMNGGEIVNDVPESSATASDYFRIKEYNVVVDKYISKVEHVESRGGTPETYNAQLRNAQLRRSVLYSNAVGEYPAGYGTMDDTRNNNPVSVEYGDKVTYEILIYNTTDDAEYYYVNTRDKGPYKQPQYITVDLTDTLPNKFSNLNVTAGSNASMSKENVIVENNKLTLKNVKVEAGTVGTIEVSLVVEEVKKDKVEENKVTFSNNDVRNINGYRVVNNGKRNTASDKYKLNDYNATLEEYIDTYNAEMAKYNNANGFTSGESEGFSGTTTSCSNENPLDVEKYETLTFATKVTNTANGGEAENKTNSYGKYNTRVRPTKITQTIDYGLKFKTQFKAVWHKSDGKTEEITKNITTETNDDISGKKRSWTHTINNEEIILSPNEYIIYYTTIEVTESNLCLDNLQIHSEITTLTNINRKDSSVYGTKYGVIENNGHNRIVTDQNISTKKSDDDYVRLKDVVIAGTVWLDSNGDGYNENESGKEKDIKVKLYRTTDPNNPVSTIEFKIDENGNSSNPNGFYTFGRVPKADSNKNYYQYYVEFEYDGLKYKATEIYGGDDSEKADGMKNLNAEGGGEKWRQGNTIIDKDGNEIKLADPDATSGDENYKFNSNAYEFDDVRETFNKTYQTIGFNKAYSGTDSTDTLTYTKDGHTSTLVENAGRVMTARSFIQKDDGARVNSTDAGNKNPLFLQNYAGHSNTYPETEYLKFINLGLVEREKADISLEADVYSVKNTINGEEMTYEFNKNSADSTAADYDTLEAGQKNAYRKDENYNLNLYDADYNYKSDSYYQENGTIKDYKTNESELTSEVTYEITIHNNSDENIETAINEMAIYYDKKFKNITEYTNVKVKDSSTGLLLKNSKEIPNVKILYGTEDNFNEITDKKSRSSYNNTKPNNMGNYNVLYLSGFANDDYIPNGESRIIRITFVVDKNDARDMNLGDLNMIAEVSAYTTKYGEGYKNQGLRGTHEGLVDCDSNPGNLHLNGLEDYSNYEDDKYKVGITMKKFSDPPNENPTPSTRSIKGIVWDDARSNTVSQGEGENKTAIQYLGDGEYEEGKANDPNATTNSKDPNLGNGEKPISGVKVSLVEVVQTDEGKYYEYPAKDSLGNPISAVTDTDGKYTLKDYIPGYYKVRFDYGWNKDRDDNIIYNGQDYKSTAYYNKEYYDENAENKVYQTDNIGGSANFDYFDKVKTALDEENKSDALDDEIRRLNVNGYSETMTNKQAKIFSESLTNDELESALAQLEELQEQELTEDEKEQAKSANNANRTKLVENTHMYADSTIFYTKPEAVESGTTSIDTTQEEFDKNRLWKISNLDFGLEYRSESSIVLDKDIETVELVTSDNKTLVKMCFKDEEKDGEIVRSIDTSKSKGYENVQFITGEDGFVYINMDNEILEGCTIKADYRIDAENQSDIDRINQNLDDIKFEIGANNYGNAFKVYATHQVITGIDEATGEETTDTEYTYNANLTAAQLLASQYFDGESYKQYTSDGIDYNYTTTDKDGKTEVIMKSPITYFTKIKKPYRSTGETEIITNINPETKVTLQGSEYYGMYLGQTYYTGNIGTNDKVAELKVDQILDYVDNDFTFEQSQNHAKNRLWKTTTSAELKNMLDWSKVKNKEIEGQKYLVDEKDIQYDTENRSNLALSVDDNKSGKYYNNDGTYQDRIGNVSLSRFLKPMLAVKESDRKVTEYKNDVNEAKGAQQYIGRINLMASKILSAEDIGKGTGLSYTNIAEAVQYTTLTGRRTKLPKDGTGGVIGNGIPGENDTDETEVITISPPTGFIE